MKTLISGVLWWSDGGCISGTRSFGVKIGSNKYFGIVLLGRGWRIYTLQITP